MMRKLRRGILCLLCLLCLTACGAPDPETAADGTAWSSSWVTVGNVLGI